MANRSYNALLALREAEYHFYMRTYRDWSPNGYDGTPNGNIPLKRCIGQVVGTTPRAVGETVAVALSIAVDTAWSWEFSGFMRDGSGGGNGRIFDDGTSALWYNEANDRISWTCGTPLNGTNGLIPSDQPIHLMGAKDAAGAGHLYVNGTPDVSGAVNVGGLGAATLLFDRAAADRNLICDCYLLRFFNTEIDPDEAAFLYEHSRIKLWPGAPKRSGIMSPS